MKKILIKGGLIAIVTALALLAGCLSYSVESVEVSIDGNATSIDAGKTIQFNFLVTATGKDTSQAQRVNWSVSSTNDGTGPVTPGTNISPSGTLAVSADEIYPILYVRATHAAVRSKYDFKQIQVKGPKVGSVVLSVTGEAASVVAGGTAKLSAFVAGQAPNQGLTYSVGSASSGTGAVAAGTAIAGDGTLTVSANETASSLYVKAVSNSDATKFDIKEIKVITVTSVTVSAEGGTARVLRGGKLKFNAVVAGNNNPGQNVTWKVSSNAAGTGTVTDGTTVASDGTLSVAAGEAAATLYVTATSSINTTKSGSITVTIPTVTSVTVSPVNPQIKRGEGATFTARVQGTGNPGQDVTWKLDGIGGSTTVTTITSNGMVIVNAAEILSQLLITATSVDDPAKSGNTMITIPAIPAAIETFSGYIINGSGAAFSATKGGAAVGTANQPIQTVIEAVRTHANGAACQIRFGNGTTALDIGAASVNFNNTGGTWGALTLSGKITGNVSENNSGIIIISNRDISVTSSADISNTGTTTNSHGIFNNTGAPITITGGTISATTGNAVQTYTGPLNISGGKISVTTGTALRCTAEGPINISGGTISATSGSGIWTNSGWGVITITGGSISATTGVAVNNRSYGSVNISGGTISATTGTAVYNFATGKVTISGTAKITSANPSANGGTVDVFNFTVGNNTGVRVEITGGTVENTSTTTGNVINNPSIGGITITGGTITKAGSGGFAINNTGGGAVNNTGAKITGAIK